MTTILVISIVIIIMHTGIIIISIIMRTMHGPDRDMDLGSWIQGPWTQGYGFRGMDLRSWTDPIQRRGFRGPLITNLYVMCLPYLAKLCYESG